MSKKTGIKLTHILYASPEKVFEALTNPSLIEIWSNGKAVFELTGNGKVELFNGWVKGNVIRFTKNSFLSYSWKPAEWKQKTTASTVEMELKKHEAGTVVIITHVNFPDQKEADNHKEGWVDFVFDPLNDFLLTHSS